MIKPLHLFLFFLLVPNIALAYLDPGTGSLLLSSVVAIATSALFVFKGLLYKFKTLVGGGNPLRKESKRNHALVFYSEGKQYHNVFKPMLHYLDSISYPYTYLTSCQKDLELFLQYKNTSSQNSNENPNAQFEYIGDSSSNRAIARLNSLEADVVMMTTPQLHVLQIKRSSHVKHYCHIIHSLAHVDTYEIFALDYFDSVFTNSIIHTDFIRATEQVRNLKAKEIVITGCTYLDVLNEKLQDFRKQKKDNKIQRQPFFTTAKDSTTYTILLSPSWGREALLSKYGMKVITPLMQSRHRIIIRPHPQSHTSEKEILDTLKQQTKAYDNVVWDTNTDNIYAMNEADIMIGDFSGVLFDFICLFEKPIITTKLQFNTTGYDLEDIYETPWVSGALEKIGASIEEKDFNNLPVIIENLLNTTQSKEALELQKNLQDMKSLLWKFQGSSGKQSALEILRIQKEILEQKLGEKLFYHQEITNIARLIQTNASTLPLQNHTMITLKD